MRDHDETIGQVAAYFAYHNDGKIDSLKLMKLIYIANRYSLIETGHPIYFDTMSCVNSGVILHKTRKRLLSANFINRHIIVDAHNWVHAICYNGDDDLDYMSEFNLRILRKTWDMHGHQSDSELRYYMDELYHEIDRNGKDITFLDILNELPVFTKDVAQHLYDAIMFFQELDETVCLS